MTPAPRAAAKLLGDEALRSEIGERSEDIRLRQAALAEYVAELAERTRLATQTTGRSEKAGPTEAVREVQKLTGVTRREAQSLVDVGGLLGALGGDESAGKPWLTGVSEAVRDGGISVEKAHLIQAGLGEPTESVSPEDLVLATERVLEVAPTLTPEQLAAETRAMREQLDAQHVADEERRIQHARSVKLYKHRDGSGTLVAKLDREAVVVVGELLDAATGPKRFGPRFVSSDGTRYQDAVKDDARSIEQMGHDALFTVLRLGLGADAFKLPGRQPAVRVIVTARDLADRTGYGELEGKSQTISLETIDRHLCDSGSLQIVVDAFGTPLNHGREKRLFTEAQRTALAIRDGGCMDDCDRPASWCEAHHIVQWRSINGLTDLTNGILLCRYHHLDLHNRGAHIEYHEARRTHVMVEKDGRRRDLRTKARIQERIAVANAS